MKALQRQVMKDMMSLQHLKAFSMEEIKEHNKPNDCWVLIDGIVYDVTKFYKFHPGGALLLLRSGGKDATEDFKQMHRMDVLKQPKYEKLIVGRLAVEDLEPKEQKKLMVAKVQEKWMPMSDHYWLDPRGTLKAHWMTPHHLAWQKKVREFIHTEIHPNVHKWDEQGKYPLDLHEKAYKAGVGGAIWPSKYGGTPPEGGWDVYKDMIYLYEMGKCRCGGIMASWMFTANIALPPILAHGSEEMKQRVGAEVISGKAIIALGVTEPWGGSDVANLRCTAVKDGTDYIVNGEKKFITSGMTAKYFTVAVRTDPTKKGLDGISFLLIEADRPGFDKKKIPTMGWWAGNTAFLSFENCRVPQANLIGKENEGFRYIMENFNHERFACVAMMAGQCHDLIAESIRFARIRKTFGQPLIKHQVIRHKIAEMSLRTEAVYAMCEQLAHHMKIGVPQVDLGGRIALAKVLSTKTFEMVAREAAQIMGGNSYQRGGHGEFVERAYREVRVGAIGGGSEEILMDLGVRMAKL